MKSIIQIKYSNKQLRYSLFFGVLWIVIFVGYLILRSESIFGYGYLVIGIIFLATYFYKRTVHYATIKNGVLVKNMLVPKSIKLDQIIEVRYFAGEYKLVAKDSEIKINTMEIDKDSLVILKRILDNLKIIP